MKLQNRFSYLITYQIIGKEQLLSVPVPLDSGMRMVSVQPNTMSVTQSLAFRKALKLMEVQTVNLQAVKNRQC